jgi:hypothetical protein
VFLTVTRSVRAILIRKPGSRKRLSHPLSLALLFSLVDSTVSVVCPTCADTISGCAGGDACPLLADVTANAAIFAAGQIGTNPVLHNLLSPSLLQLFPRNVCEAVVGVATAPVGGREVDFSLATYNTIDSVTQAARFGHCPVADAMVELMRRRATADEPTAAQCTMAVEMLKLFKDKSYSSSQGVYTFIFAMIGLLFAVSQMARLSLNESQSAKSSELTASLRRPQTSSEFFESIHLFIHVVCALGLAHFTVLMVFVENVVHKSMRDFHLMWEATHELFLIYLAEMESDTTRTLNFANIYAKGKIDTFIAQAKINAAAFFRSRAGTALTEASTTSSPTGVAIKYNGKSNNSADKCCVAWNLGKPHSSSQLAGDGTCRFSHVCMQWVSDKGPGGQCRGAHEKSKCNYAADKKLDRPAK